MAVSIQKFFNQLKTDQIRTQNMYEVRVHSDISEVDQFFDGQGENGNRITMYADGFAVPERTQEFTEVSFKGYPVPVPTVIKMGQDHTMTIRADVAGNFRRGFLTWAAAVADPAIENGTLFAGDRRFNEASYIQVSLLGNGMDVPVETYRIVGVKISSVGALTMSNNDSGVATFEVGFKSLYWYVENVASDAFNSKFDSAGAVESGQIHFNTPIEI